jgi:hypothetical protein
MHQDEFRFKLARDMGPVKLRHQDPQISMDDLRTGLFSLTGIQGRIDSWVKVAVLNTPVAVELETILLRSGC